MVNQSKFLGKTLTISVILLFISVSVQPAMAIVEPEIIQLSTLNPDETRYLANLSMDFGENITNDRIDYEEKGKIPEGDYAINVKINFRCPKNLKIVVKYEYYAEVYDLVTLYPIYFCDANETVTLINGSNPPDIDIDYTEFCPMHSRNQWLLVLRIKANLTAYEFVDREWVLLHYDDTFKEIKDSLVFNRIRPSERTKTSESDDCNLCAKKVSKQHIVLISGLLNIIEKYENQLSVLSKHFPEVADLYNELSDSISTLKEMNSNIIEWDFKYLCAGILTLDLTLGLIQFFLAELQYKNILSYPLEILSILIVKLLYIPVFICYFILVLFNCDYPGP